MKAGIPFLVERQESGIWFLVRRANWDRHHDLQAEMPDDGK
jgi:hypothetical protein